MAATLRLARSGPGTPHTVRPRSQFRQLPLATWPFEPRLEPGRIFPLHAQRVAQPVGRSRAPNWGPSFRAPFDSVCCRHRNKRLRGRHCGLASASYGKGPPTRPTPTRSGIHVRSWCGVHNQPPPRSRRSGCGVHHLCLLSYSRHIRWCPAENRCGPSSPIEKETLQP